MTEIMPVPRNSHITVLRPPSIGRGAFCILEIEFVVTKEVGRWRHLTFIFLH